MRDVLLVGAGGAVGAVLRVLLSNGVYGLLGRQFPHGTLVVNVLGSLLMGAAYVLLVERMPAAGPWRVLVMAGGLGAFTTFSTFALDTIMLLEHGALGRAVGNMLASLALCVGGVWVGIWLTRQL